MMKLALSIVYCFQHHRDQILSLIHLFEKLLYVIYLRIPFHFHLEKSKVFDISSKEIRNKILLHVLASEIR